MLTRKRITIMMMGVSFIATMQTGIAWASVGQFHFTSGDVKVVGRDGKTRAGSKGGAIDQGETIITAPAASAQLKMIDGGIIAVRPDTQLRVDTYIFKGKEDGSEKGQLSLLRGGFRTITGAIGHINKDNYKVSTPSATIGIRGTDHEPVFIPPALPGQPPVANAGTYDKVNVGVAYIATPLGSVNIQPNQVGFAAPDARPQILPVVPGIYKQAPTPIQATDEKEKGKENGEQQGAAAAKPAEEQADSAAASEQAPTDTAPAPAASEQASPESAPAPVRTTAAVDTTTITPTGSSVVTIAPPAITNTPVLVVETTDPASGTTLNLTDSTLTDSTGTVVPITETVSVIPPPIPVEPYLQTDVAFAISASNGRSEMYGAYGYWMNDLTAAGNVAPSAATPSFVATSSSWDWSGVFGMLLPGASGAVNGQANSFATTGIEFGRWLDVPTIAQFSNGIPFGPGLDNYSKGSSSWAVAPEGYLDNPTILSTATGGAVTGVFNYVLNGAPAPRDQNGMAGVLNWMTLTADFTTLSVTAALSASLGATTWTASSPAPMPIGTWNGSSAGFGGGLMVTSNNAGVTSGGYLNGNFTSQNYAGAVVGYTLYDYLPANAMITTSLSGIAALTRNGVTGNATVANGAPAPTGKYVVAEAGGYGNAFLQIADAVITTSGVLTGYGTTRGPGDSSVTTITCTTCTGQAAPDTATGIQFGTWDAGSRSYTSATPFGGQFHWIKGPGPDPFYLPEVLTGTMTYTLDGGTAPTNQNGQTGTLTIATLGVDFPHQTVDITLGLTGVNGHNWSATGTGIPLEWTDYSKNGFWAYSSGGPGSLTITMDGGTPGQGNIAGQLTGNGLIGALFQYQFSAPLPMPVVPATFTATDTLTAQASSATVSWFGPSSPVEVVFPADPTGTLNQIAPTTLTVALAPDGLPTSATVSGGVNATVGSLSQNPFTGAYEGLSDSGQFVSVETFGHQVTASGLAGGLKYANFGGWIARPDVSAITPSATGPLTSGVFAGGMLLTPPVSMPVNNYAINGYYSGGLIGMIQDSATNMAYKLAGFLNLNANFSTGDLTGTGNYISVYDPAFGIFAGYFNDLALAMAIAGNSFAGTVTAGTVPAGFSPSPVNVTPGATGSASGHFYGPNANELTGVLALNDGAINLAGAFGAANGTSHLPPYESVNGTVALVATTSADTATPYRLTAISGYDPASVGFYDNGMLMEGSFNNAANVIETAGQVTAFDLSDGYASTNYLSSVTLASGSATLTNFGSDPVSGISWGRWQGGSIDVTDRTTGTMTSASLGASSLHWLATPTMTAPVALPTSGTYTYTLAGGTAPTDNLGNVGVLNIAILAADFTAQTIDVNINIGINNALGATIMDTRGTGIPIQKKTMFDAYTNNLPGSANLLTATCVGPGCAGPSPQASIAGALTGPTGEGAGMTYGFVNGANVVSGVVAFKR